MYPRQKMEECENNTDYKICHKKFDKGEEVQ